MENQDEQTVNPVRDLFKSYPELNAAAVARRMGITQSLFAKYITGGKRPSPERMAAIIGTVEALGREISQYCATLRNTTA